MRGRLILAFSIFLLILVVGPGFIAFSVWMESRFPSGEVKHALLPRVQRVITKPVVDRLGREVERYVRGRAEAPYMETGLSLDETIRRFLDTDIGLSERRILAYRLARVGSKECVGALLKVLEMAGPDDKAFMAQLIGNTRNPAAKQWLWPLLYDADEQVVAASIRGLSVIGGDDVAGWLAGILADPQRVDHVRIEAALALGEIGTPAGGDALIEIFGQTSSDEVATQILNSLGRFKFPIIAEAFERYLSAADTPPAMRVAAVKALVNSSAEAVPFLLQLTAGDADPDVRASAAWAVSAYGMGNELGSALSNLVARENETIVRRRLYEALLPQSDIPADQLLPIVRAENDIVARVAGFNAVGVIAHQQPGSGAALEFDENIVPELVQIATSPNSLNIQMRAVFALRRAQTAAAQAALTTIASTASPQVADAARHGL